MKVARKIFNQEYKSFTELEKNIEKLQLSKDKGDAMEYFAYYYFIYFQERYGIEEVYMENDIPEGIKEKIKLEPTDYGVDGVFIKTDNTITAYQVKFRTSRMRLTGTDLSTFWAEAEYADQRLVISNSNSLPKVAHKKSNQSSILISELLKLDEKFFNGLFKYYAKDIKTTQKKELFTPRIYQQKMITDVLKGFEKNDRGKLIAACGVGKTLTAMWLHEDMNAESVLYVVPSLSLIKQTLDSWLEQSEENFDFLCVCSDKSVVEFEDEISLNSSEVDFPVTTDPLKVVSFLNESSRKKIIFVTYNSLDVIVSACIEKPNYEFSLGVFDESHRTAGTKSAKMFTYGLYDKYISMKKRLFMTATERLVSPRIRENAKELGDVIFSMDDKELYGPILTSLNFGEAIEQDIINDYQIVLATIDESELENYNNIRTMAAVEIGDKNKLIDKDVLLKQLILKKVLNDLNVKKMITYHSRVKNAQNFVQGADTIYSLDRILDTKDNNDIEKRYFNHVNGTMSSGQREDIMKKFEHAETGIVSNARCLTEGIDVPVIDAVYFVDPKNSLVDIVQAVGRALRKSKEKVNEFSYIVIPMIIPENNSMFDEFDDNDFSTIHNVVQALRMQDNRLADQIDELNMHHVKGDYKKGSKGRSILQIVPYDKLAITNFEESLSLRIAQISKNTDISDINKTDWKEKNARKSRVKRKLVSMGDYSMDSYLERLIKPTMKKFIDNNENLEKRSRKDIRINNNNISHTQRFGIIKKEKQNYSITDLGRKILKTEYEDFNLFAQQQMLKYYSVNNDDKNNIKILYPYRTILKVLKHTKQLSRLEFLYTLYHLQSTENNDIEKAIENVFVIRKTYPNIEKMNSRNQENILEILNSKSDVEFSYNDVWTSRTTTYNQFNYFKNHLSLFDEVMDLVSDNKILKIKEGSELIIEDLLSIDDKIEYFDYTEIDKLEKYYTS